MQSAVLFVCFEVAFGLLFGGFANGSAGEEEALRLGKRAEGGGEGEAGLHIPVTLVESVVVVVPIRSATSSNLLFSSSFLLPPFPRVCVKPSRSHI